MDLWLTANLLEQLENICVTNERKNKHKGVSAITSSQNSFIASWYKLYKCVQLCWRDKQPRQTSVNVVNIHPEL